MTSAAEEAARDIEAQDLFIDPRAMYHLALYYLGYVRGSEKNFRYAVYWLRRSAALGFAPAVFELGKCYSRGLGVPANEMLACEQYQRCRRLAGFSELSHSQRKTVDESAMRLTALKREAAARTEAREREKEAREREEAIKRWHDANTALQSAFPDVWRRQGILRRMVPSLTCCLAHESQSGASIVSAAIHRDEETHTVVVFLDAALDWISRFEHCVLEPGARSCLGPQGECKIVWPGDVPRACTADTSFGFSLRFMPTQKTSILFPWLSSRLDMFSDVTRWILWSVVDDCPCFARGFDSYADIHAYQNRTFPWSADDFPLLMSKPDEIKHHCIHNPLRDKVDGFSDFYMPDCMPNLEHDSDTQREPESKKCLAADIDDRGCIEAGDCRIKCNGEWPVGKDGRKEGDYWCPYDGRWTQCPNYCGPRI